MELDFSQFDNNLKSSFDLINNLSFCVFDLETTGGNHKADKIIEIGMVRIENLKIVDEKSFLIDPEIQIPDFIQKLTSIRPKDLINCPKIEELIDEILDFMREDILVAHNASFDVPFFNSVLTRLNREKLPNRSICTNLMTKYLIPEIMNSNLTYMSRIFDISHNKAHRALEDARATASLLLTFLQFFIRKRIKKVNQLYYPRNKYELDRVHLKKENDFQEFQDKVSDIKTPLIVTIKGAKGILLSMIPIENISNPLEKEFLFNEVKMHNYETLTIRMVGSFIDGFLKLNSQFPKLDEQTRGRILKYLYKIHLDFTNSPPTTINQKEVVIGKKDFLVVPHLIPEQYVVYPLSNLHNKNELIFRFPGHKKKFIQYVNNQSKRMHSEKLKFKKSIINVELYPFFNLFLGRVDENKDDKHFLFSKDLPSKKNSKFNQLIEKFFSQNKKTYNYPKEHV